MLIEKMRLTVLPRVNRNSWLEADRIASPMSWCAEFAERRSSWMGMQERVIVELTTNEGLSGYGMCRGGWAAAAVLRDHLSRLVLGRDVRDHGLIYNQVLIAITPYGGGGIAMSAVSALDIALWDATAKLFEVPLYQLLGGRVRSCVPTYVTCNDPLMAGDLDCRAYKIAVPYGPADGQAGFQENIELVKRMRNAIGSERPILLDCFGGWTVPYTLSMLAELQPYGVGWLEDPLPPDNRSGYHRLRRAVPSVRLALGNFEFSETGCRELITDGLVDVVQPDLTWMGGITPAFRIMHLAEETGVEFSPHNAAEQPWAVQLMCMTKNESMAEFVMRNGDTGDCAGVANERANIFPNVHVSEEPGASGPAPGYGADKNAVELHVRN